MLKVFMGQTGWFAGWLAEYRAGWRDLYANDGDGTKS